MKQTLVVDDSEDLKPVLFLHGLNTYGDDCVHIGPLNFGPFHKYLKTDLATLGYGLITVAGNPSSQLSEIVVSTRDQLLSHSLWNTKGIHILGHSMGGLVGRRLVLDSEIRRRILSLVTLATPHRGSLLAEAAAHLSLKKSVLSRALSVVGYRLENRTNAFSQLSPKAIEVFNSKTPDVSGIEYGCIVAGSDQPLLSWPMRSLSKTFKWVMRDSVTSSFGGGRSFLLQRGYDGMVSADSQKWGTIVCETPLDHFGVLGYDFFFRRANRRVFRKYYWSMLEALVSYWKKVEGSEVS